MANKGGMALGFVLLVLFSVLAVPTVIDSTDSTEVESQQIEEGDTEFYNHQIEVTLVDATKSEVTLVVTDTETSERENVTVLSEGTETVSFDRGDIDVTNTVSTSTSATISVEYASTYGYSREANVLIDNLPIILIAMVFIGIMAFVGVRV